MYAMIDYSSKMWVCPHCATRNFFPAAYADLSPERPFPELCRSTIEYAVPQSLQYPPVFIFIVDTAVSEDELDACKSTLKQALEMMPENSLVGLLSFGTHVHVHELQASGSGISKVYVFRGTGAFTPNTIALQLGFKAVARQKDASNGFLATKFLVSLEDEFQIETALDSLQRRTTARRGARARRCRSLQASQRLASPAASAPSASCSLSAGLARRVRYHARACARTTYARTIVELLPTSRLPWQQHWLRGSVRSA
jgi:protein transport protein SEC23